MKSISKISKKLVKKINVNFSKVDTSFLIISLILFSLSILIHYNIYNLNKSRDTILKNKSDIITDKTIEIETNTITLNEKANDIKLKLDTMEKCPDPPACPQSPPCNCPTCPACNCPDKQCPECPTCPTCPTNNPNKNATNNPNKNATDNPNKNAINNAIINPNNANNNAIINPNNSNNNTNNNANNANNANNNANNANINPNNANNANIIEPLPVDPLQTNDNVFSNFFSFFTGGNNNNNNNNNNNAIREQEIINEPVDVENLDGFEELPAYTSLDETENENP
jgi:hypothetical protein